MMMMMIIKVIKGHIPVFLSLSDLFFITQSRSLAGLRYAHASGIRAPGSRPGGEAGGSRWWRACRAAWTGRCRSGRRRCWGSAAWPASSPGPPSDSASCSGPARPASAGGGGRGSSPLSPRWGGAEVRVEIEQTPPPATPSEAEGYPLRRRYHQAPSMRPPAQPPWLRVSQEIRFWGDSWGVM